MDEVYFVDTVRCLLGSNSNCVMHGKLRLGPACAKCGFNKRVYEKRIRRIRDGEMKTYEKDGKIISKLVLKGGC